MIILKVKEERQEDNNKDDIITLRIHPTKDYSIQNRKIRIFVNKNRTVELMKYIICCIN